MVVGPFVEVAVVVGLLSGGTLLNRDTSVRLLDMEDDNLPASHTRTPCSEDGMASSRSPADDKRTTMAGDTIHIVHGDKRPRTLYFGPWRRTVWTPNTERFRNRLLSRVLRKFPFLVEAWYWALIYWVYQLARAVSAVLLIDESVVQAARRHALQLMRVEEALAIFVEPAVQRFFLQRRPAVMRGINRLYAFVHIPGTILFLIVLYYITTTRPQRQMQMQMQQAARRPDAAVHRNRSRDRYRPDLYERRRRTMAMCNLVAFVLFTAWPVMPPRLLGADHLAGHSEPGPAHGYAFVDTVHATADGAQSVWTTNRFCNQYAAMPSLHFGYAFLIGLTVATLPLDAGDTRRAARARRRLLAVLGGLVYPALIWIAIIATANHFVLVAVVGGIVCLAVWQVSGLLRNLLPLEDYFLSAVRIHKPSKRPATPSFRAAERVD
ncbi:hypothetical protein SPBR_08931 [Sporothrix brasiliensis 5110]|uniref:Inositolphosphotransferase Aur1/Ipt1 domain-containing protein n=1 Tax=Sporothrix brasiliensis 5110 TaxID=1398154 RepID=A0A0C2IS00_9PEZI|nr:uncharacterized protein SPBR_08931 [Sporothrix brasiliensis 5110]KIH87782.1 hypothetical protein SPBR_08931 [Sporothrix brasiliensis 5110]